VLPLLLLLSNSACSPQQQLFLFCFQREDRLWQARGFFIRERCLRTRNKNLVGTSPPASALCALAQPTRACVLCVRAITLPFSLRGKVSPRTMRAHAQHTLAQ
jgi:hypothetical protein